MNSIIVLDFSGTLTHEEIAQEASNRRFKFLGQKVNQKWLKRALANNDHYQLNKKLISRQTGLKDDRELTIIMTDLFKYFTLQVVNQRKNKAFQPGIIAVLKKLKKQGYSLAVVSGTRTDIIKNVFKITGHEKLIDYIFGQPPELGFSNEQLLACCARHGRIAYIVGDKLTDLVPAKKYRAKTIFVTWGHPLGQEKQTADFTISQPKGLLKIIK